MQEHVFVKKEKFDFEAALLRLKIDLVTSYSSNSLEVWAWMNNLQTRRGARHQCDTSHFNPTSVSFSLAFSTS